MLFTWCDKGSLIKVMPCLGEPCNLWLSVFKGGEICELLLHVVTQVEWSFFVILVTVCFLSGGPLHLGDIEELPGNTLCVRCPWHSWKFDLDTGLLKQPKRPGVSSVVYPVIVKEDGKLMIGFDQFDPKYFSVDSSF